MDLTRVSEWKDGSLRGMQDVLVAEEPLEIRVNGKALTVTMRTPGDDRELAAGFLFTEGIITKAEQISAIRTSSGERNVVDVQVHGGRNGHFRRNFRSNSGCGVCGKASIEEIRLRSIRRPDSDFQIDPSVLCTLPEKLRAGQAVFGRTGALHAAAIFTPEGELLALREDVGRHNAVDKIAGWALLAGRLPLSSYALMVSGRGGFEIVQKALAAGLPVVASVSAPSGLAVRLAREFGQTLIGFLRGRRFVIYSGESRIAQALEKPAV
jgi:FdhD protein